MVDRVDAIDFSAAMVSAGQRLPSGLHPNLRWICCKAEDAPLVPPYALITAGNSLHWMDWHALMPRMAEVRQLEFDRRVRDLVTPYAAQGWLDLEVRAQVTWGRPIGC